MQGLGHFLLLLLWGSSRAQGKACKFPEIPNGHLAWWVYRNYPDFFFPMAEGRTIEYACSEGFTEENPPVPAVIRCSGGQWYHAPRCLKLGVSCGPAPSLAHGDMLRLQQPSFYSGTDLWYRCQRHYKHRGPVIVSCRHGVWTPLPQCLEPCSLNEEKMAANNINQTQPTRLQTSHIEHGDHVAFSCLSEDYSQDPAADFRPRCDRGHLTYPRCIKPEPCTIRRAEMSAKNIRTTQLPMLETSRIEHGDHVEFSCISEDYVRDPAASFRPQCQGGQLTYPRCTKPAPCIANSSVMAANRIRLAWTVNSSLPVADGGLPEFTCVSRHYLREKGSSFTVRCKGGILDYPRCRDPGSCAPSPAEMGRNNLILHRDNAEIAAGESVEFSCKPGFYTKPEYDMRRTCHYGRLEYPECVSNPCHVTAEKLNAHNVQLHRSHRDTVSFVDRVRIEFTCKSGYKTSQSLFVKCTLDGFAYPTCTSSYPCRLNQEDLDGNHLELDEKHGSTVIYQHGQSIEFHCADGYFETGPLFGTCIHSRITFPQCVYGKPCLLSQDVIHMSNIVLLPAHEEMQHVNNNDSVAFLCKHGFRPHQLSSDLLQVCKWGVLAYPKCIATHVLN